MIFFVLVDGNKKLRKFKMFKIVKLDKKNDDFNDKLKVLIISQKQLALRQSKKILIQTVDRI